jgi:predicted house-cleaning noncanonical NTP pyrophosphatase (MazG superfamily)
MKYNKLVRDKIPEYLKNINVPYKIHIADNAEYWEKLKTKLQEEVAEFINDDANISEIADILEVIEAICNYQKFNQSELNKIKEAKAQERGKFEKRIILEES